LVTRLGIVANDNVDQTRLTQDSQGLGQLNVVLEDSHGAWLPGEDCRAVTGLPQLRISKRGGSSLRIAVATVPRGNAVGKMTT
jgi:hypothetical protein